MNDFTVLMQIERQMQEQFHGQDEAAPLMIRRRRLYDTARLQLSAMLRTVAKAIEPQVTATEHAQGHRA